jgi:hypothetical protein
VTPPAPEASAPQLPRWRARWSKVLPVLIVLDLAVLFWIVVFGGGQIVLYGMKHSATGAGNPIGILVFLLAALSLVKHGRAGLVGRTVTRLVTHVRAASWRVRGALALSVWVGVVHVQALINLNDTLEPPSKAPPEMAQAIQVNSANLYSIPLLDTLVRGAAVGPFVLRVHDMDPRGHEAAFYLYPRLLRMEPSERRWGLRDRMLHLGPTPPEVRARERPSLATSRAFARSSGQAFVIAAPDGARVDGAEPASEPQGGAEQR